MTDFIELFIQETVATIDGMMGRVAVLSHKEDGPVSADLLASPFAKVVVGVSLGLSLIHISEPTRPRLVSRMPSSA